MRPHLAQGLKAPHVADVGQVAQLLDEVVAVAGQHQRVGERPHAGGPRVLAQQGQLPKAGSLADACQLPEGVIEDCESALLNDIESVTCRGAEREVLYSGHMLSM